MTSTDTCDNDKQSTIIFERCEESDFDRLNHSCDIMCIASKETNKLLLVRCPDSVVKDVLEVITSYWPKGIIKTNKTPSDYLTKNLYNWEFLLGGEPWNSKGEQSTGARRLWIKV